MTRPPQDWDIHRLGIVSTHLAGTDGLSLEAEKWAYILRERGFTCFYFAGELDRLKDIYYKRPIVVIAYAIYLKDIKPKGFDVNELYGDVIPAAVAEARDELSDPERRREMTESNDPLGRQSFSCAP